MSRTPEIAVLMGGVSAEREVSIGSGRAALDALQQNYSASAFDIDQAALPSALNPEKQIVFSTLHGVFGEDGQIQSLLDEAGVIYAGCDAESSRLTFDKVSTKQRLRECSLPVTDELAFHFDALPEPETLIAALGSRIVIKPTREGSSVGLHFAESRDELVTCLAKLDHGEWMAEPRVIGRELTVGILDGRALEIVEILPRSGRFDFESKYTVGATVYEVPAELSSDTERLVKRAAEEAFAACGCRDYARIDFMLSEDGNFCILEINTLPGLKETSLLPMAAQAEGINFPELLQKLVSKAIVRFNHKYSVC